MLPFSETIKLIKINRGFEFDYELEDELKIKRKSLANWKKKKDFPKKLIEYLKIKNISLDEVIFGQEKKAINVAKDIRPIIIQTQFNDGSIKDAKADDYRTAPLVEGKIAAGTGLIVEENVKSWLWLYKPELKKHGRTNHDLIAVQLAEGIEQAESMRPTINPGDIVLIDRTDQKFINNGIFAVRFDHNQCAIKRLKKIKELDREPRHPVIAIHSDNPEYDALLTDKDPADFIIGRVIWMWRSLIS